MSLGLPVPSRSTSSRRCELYVNVCMWTYRPSSSPFPVQTHKLSRVGSTSSPCPFTTAVVSTTGYCPFRHLPTLCTKPLSGYPGWGHGRVEGPPNKRDHPGWNQDLIGVHLVGSWNTFTCRSPDPVSLGYHRHLIHKSVLRPH